MITIKKENTDKMSKEDTIMFHHVTEKMLYLDNRSIIDL